MVGRVAATKLSVKVGVIATDCLGDRRPGAAPRLRPDELSFPHLDE